MIAVVLRYFAYGSNMLTERLRARVGEVLVLGPGVLADYRHSFTKLGRDGTGKGNISAAPGARVYGVLYELSATQLYELARHEGGYVAVEVAVFARRVLLDEDIDAPLPGAGEDAAARLMAHTFQAERPVGPMLPRADYLSYYTRAMSEHGLPVGYRELIEAQALAGRGR